MRRVKCCILVTSPPPPPPLNHDALNRLSAGEPHTDRATGVSFETVGGGCHQRSPWISSPRWFKYMVRSVFLAVCISRRAHTRVLVRSLKQKTSWRVAAVCFGFFSSLLFITRGADDAGGREEELRQLSPHQWCGVGSRIEVRNLSVCAWAPFWSALVLSVSALHPSAITCRWSACAYCFLGDGGRGDYLTWIWTLNWNCCLCWLCGWITVEVTGSAVVSTLQENVRLFSWNVSLSCCIITVHLINQCISVHLFVRSWNRVFSWL